MAVVLLLIPITCLGGAGAGAAEAGDPVYPLGDPLTVSDAACARLVVHRPEEDVAFEPGRDLRGRAVAPADLGDRPALALPERTRVRIEVDSGERFGLPSDPASFDADIEVGSLEVGPDGDMTFNGQPLQSETARELGRLCRERLGRPD